MNIKELELISVCHRVECTHIVIVQQLLMASQEAAVEQINQMHPIQQSDEETSDEETSVQAEAGELNEVFIHTSLIIYILLTNDQLTTLKPSLANHKIRIKTNHKFISQYAVMRPVRQRENERRGKVSVRCT